MELELDMVEIRWDRLQESAGQFLKHRRRSDESAAAGEEEVRCVDRTSG